MKKKYKIYLVIAAIVIIAAAALKILSGASGPSDRKQNMTIVKVESPRRETIVSSLKFTGDIAPILQASIFSKVSGNIEKIFVDIGTFVRKGEILAQIDTTEIFQQYQLASATYQNAYLAYRRNKDLSEQNLIAKQDFDNSEAAMKIASANFETAKIRLDYSRITAPFPGYITKRYLDPGAMVNSNNSTLFTLMDLSSVKVMVDILEKDIPLIKPGKKGIITVDAFPGEKFYGTVTRLSGAVDLSTRTMAVEVDVVNRSHLLKPGMFANITIVVGERENAITVPTQAILKDESGHFVFVVSEGKAKRLSVQPGAEQDGRIEIISGGLNGSESVITTGQQYVKDGGQITVQP